MPTYSCLAHPLQQWQISDTQWHANEGGGGAYVWQMYIYRQSYWYTVLTIKSCCTIVCAVMVFPNAPELTELYRYWAGTTESFMCSKSTICGVPLGLHPRNAKLCISSMGRLPYGIIIFRPGGVPYQETWLTHDSMIYIHARALHNFSFHPASSPLFILTVKWAWHKKPIAIKYCTCYQLPKCRHFNALAFLIHRNIMMCFHYILPSPCPPPSCF